MDSRLWIFLLLALWIPARGSAEEDFYQDLLPPQAVTEVKRALKTISFNESILRAQPSVLFVSGQSFSTGNENTLNRIHFFEGKKFDVWIMRQSNAGYGFDFAHWYLLAILVNRQDPHRAYYLQFDPAPVPVSTLPKPGQYTAACYECHSSGPRLIRPRLATKWLAPLKREELQRIDAWNRRILNYRVIENYIPSIQRKLLPKETKQWEPVSHRACVECHSATSGVRAPLLRLHKYSILALIDHVQDPRGYYVSAAPYREAFMPMHGPKLSPQERDCLDGWLEGEIRKGCNDRGEMLPKKRSIQLVDSSSSEIRASPRSPLGSFSVDGFVLSGRIDCESEGSQEELCHGDVQADLRFLTTGISLRDRHLKSFLDVANHPFATLEMKEIRFTLEGGLPAPKPVNGKLRLAGSEQVYDVWMDCTGSASYKRCAIRHWVIALGRHDLKTPSFLGASVQEEVPVSGEIVFRLRSPRELPTPLELVSETLGHEKRSLSHSDEFAETNQP